MIKHSAGPLQGTLLYRTAAGGACIHLRENDTRAPWASTFSGSVSGDLCGGFSPAEISVRGRAGALNDRSRVEMCFVDKDGHTDMQVSVDANNTLHIVNKPAVRSAGGMGKVAIEVPLLPGSGELKVPCHEKIGRVEVAQNASSIRLRLYPVDDRGAIARSDVLVYETDKGALFME